MDNLNPIQNPSVPPSMSSSQPLGAMPAKKKSPLFLIVVVVILAFGALVWWYVSRMAVEPVVQLPPSQNQEVREDTLLNKEVQDTDLGNLDAEFQAVDSDLNSL